MKRYKWTVDDEANYICWTPLRGDTLNLVGPIPIKVLDLGGGAGDFSNKIYQANKLNFVVSIDMDIGSLRKAVEGINPVQGDILRLPFKNGSFDGVVGRAILHHIPRALEKGILEIHRVLREGGLVVFQEPCDGNLFANLSRRFFITEIHDEGESPLNQKNVLDVTSKYFDLKMVKNHFFFSYLMPHIVSRSGPFRKLLVALTRVLTALDARLLRFRLFKRRSAYISILASKASKRE